MMRMVLRTLLVAICLLAAALIIFGIIFAVTQHETVTVVPVTQPVGLTLP